MRISALFVVVLSFVVGCSAKAPADDPIGVHEGLTAKLKAETVQPPTIVYTSTGTTTGTGTGTMTWVGSIVTATTTGTTTKTDTQTATATKTYSATAVVTATFTGTRTGTLTSSGTRTATKTATGTATWTGTYRGTGTATGTKTLTGTLTGTKTLTGTLSITATGTQTKTGTKSVTGTAVGTGSKTVTQTYTAAPTTTTTSTLTTTGTNTAIVTRTGIATATSTTTVTNPCYGTWAFCDNFETGNGSGWNVQQGPVQNFAVVGDGTKVYRESDATASQLYISRAQVGMAWLDATAEVRLKPLTFSSSTATVSLWGRYDATWNADCGYSVSLRGDGKLALGKRVAGVHTALGSAVTVPGGISAGTWYDVKLDMQGNILKAFVNGTELLTQTDSSCTSGSVGVGSLGASFASDDVRVTAPATNACVQNWRSTTCGDFCTWQATVQSDRAGCGAYLDCYAAHGCSPETCGGQDDVCGVNVLNPWGTASKEVADHVYNCLGCAGSVNCANPKYYNGTVCADGNPCTWGDTCQSGACVPDANRATQCNAADQCHAEGTCDTTSGRCSNPEKENGTTCTDDNACTQRDECEAGTCKGLDPVVCPASDQCHKSRICDPQTAACTNEPVDDGTSCDDGQPCTSGDTCVAGTCHGGPPATCDDGNSCTLDHCVPQTGCVHTPVSADGCSLAVQPTVTCVATRANGSLIAVFGYGNTNTATVNIPVGSENSTGGPAATIYPYVPEWFKAGIERAVMAVDFEPGQEITWSLRGATATANASSTPCLSFDGGPITLPGGDTTYIVARSQSYAAAYQDSIVATQPSGALRGAFAVTDDGAATYQLPLWVPPGLMGVQPQLGLSYNSTGGEGFLGRGWQLQGMSQIMRCRQDYARDGNRMAIQWNDEDRLCLDGQRLVLTKGRYNAPGSEYRTEKDRFLKIVQIGKDSLGPTGFVVYQPDGTRNSYGYDPAPSSAAGDFFGEFSAVLDGRIANISAVDGSTEEPTVVYDTQVRYGWALASSRDRYDNRVQYSYIQYHGVGNPIASNRYTDFRPASIKYTFNKLHAADRKIEFEYTSETGSDARVDTRFSFVSGLQLRLGHLLKKIKMYGGASDTPSLVRYYKMGYQQAARTSALLVNVTECDGTDHCADPTSFTWSTNSQAYDRKPTGLRNGTDVRAGDLNGDGRDDLIRSEETYPGIYWYSAHTANPSGDQTPFEMTGQSIGQYPPILVDLNSDGTTDKLMPVSIHQYDYEYSCIGPPNIFFGVHCVELCTAAGCTPSASNAACPKNFCTGPGGSGGPADRMITDGNVVLPYAGDFDGDGLPDLIKPFRPANVAVPIWAYLPNGKTGFTENYLPIPTTYFVRDDGTVDIGYGEFAIEQAWNAYIGDYDGDGKAELIFWDKTLRANGTPATFMHILAGMTSGAQTTSLKASEKTPGSVRYQFADLNGDGLPDAIEIPNNGGDVRVAINTGRGFLPSRAANLTSEFMFGQSVRLTNGGGPIIDPGVRIADVNLDGRADILYLGSGCRGIGSSNAGDQTCAGTVRSKIITFEAQNDRDGAVGLAAEASIYPIGRLHCPPGAGVCGSAGSQVLDVNGDGLADFIQAESEGLVLYQRQGEPPGLLKNVRDGYGATVDVQYLPTSDASVYTRIQCSYPQTCNQRGRWLVASHTFEKGTSIERKLTHTYKGARADITGIGWLGMDEHTSYDGDHYTYTKYDLDPSQNVTVNTYPKSGHPVERTEAFSFNDPTSSTKMLVRESTYSYSVVPRSFQDADGRNWPRVAVLPENNSTKEILAAQGICPQCPVPPPVIRQTVRIESQSRTYDNDYGYIKTSTGYKWEGDSEIIETDLSNHEYYADDADNWLVGRLQKDSYRSTVEGVVGRRVTSYERDLSTNALLSTTTEPNSVDPNLFKKTVLVRNTAGQVVESQDFVYDVESQSPKMARSSRVLEFDPVSGIFPSVTQNALRQITTRVTHPWLGVGVSEVDSNGLETRRKFDGLGRLRWESMPDGALKQVDYYTIDRSFNGRRSTHEVDVLQNGVSTWSYYDTQDRLVSDVKWDEHGTQYQTLIEYDKYGREARKWRPYLSAKAGTEETLPYVKSTYDSVGRPTLRQFVSGGPSQVYSSKSWTYGGLSSVAVVSGLDLGPSQTTTTRVNGAGRVVRSIEKVTVKGAGGVGEIKDVTTQYFYHPFGQLRKVVDDRGNETVMTYDVRGRRRTVTDGDTGTTTTDYDAFDQVTKETYQDAKWVKRSYDDLGRMKDETTEAGTNKTIWDASANGIGKVSARVSMDGVSTGFDYDGSGRSSGETWKLGAEAYRFDYTPDQFGRLASITYPEVEGQRRVIYYDYRANTGELYSASLGDASGPETMLWSANERNPDRRLLRESFGDGSEQRSTYNDHRGLLTSRNYRMTATDPGTAIGFTYDARGYPLTRTQYLSGSTGVETFTHDEMGRLNTWQSTGGSSNWKVEYAYDSIGNLERREAFLDGTSQDVKTFATGYTTACQNAAGPHAVTTVTSAGTTQCYGYDVRGQQTVGADQRAVSYTEYGLPTAITGSGDAWQFGYDATHRRVMKQGPLGSTTYVGSLYEKRVAADGTKTHVMYVLADGEVKAQIVVDESGGDQKIDYLMRDHLGSVTKAGGDGAWQEMRFDPYGGRIASTSPPTPASQAPASRVRLGFTGQEEDDDLGLVNMNGRIYDPALARFLTPDPLVSMRSPSQSWNRYSYVENSPLRLVDPSGFGPEEEYANQMMHDAAMAAAAAAQAYYAAVYNAGGSEALGWVLQNPGSWSIGISFGGSSGSYGTNAVGAAVGSYDEAGAGASSATGGKEGGSGEWMTASISTDKLRALTEAEKQLAKDNPMNAAIALVAGRVAVAETNARFSAEERADGGPGNAFQHAYWNALMVQWVGDDFAARWARAHEDFGPNHILDADNMMDLYNNKIGRMIGAASLEAPYIFTFGFGLAGRVEVALNMGNLVYIQDAPGWNPAQKVFIYGEHL